MSAGKENENMDARSLQERIVREKNVVSYFFRVERKSTPSLHSSKNNSKGLVLELHSKTKSSSLSRKSFSERNYDMLSPELNQLHSSAWTREQPQPECDRLSSSMSGSSSSPNYNDLAAELRQLPGKRKSGIGEMNASLVSSSNTIRTITTLKKSSSSKRMSSERRPAKSQFAAGGLLLQSSEYYQDQIDSQVMITEEMQS